MAEKSNASTAQLWYEIKKTNKLSTFVRRNQAIQESFVAYINRICVEKGLVKEHIFQRAEMDPSFGHQIFRGVRRPSREKMLQMAMGFPLTLEETQQMLLLGNKRLLHPRIMRDAALIFALQKKLSFMQIQELMEELQLPLLGEVCE